MNDAYLPYQTLDFAQDEAFIDWVKHQKQDAQWRQWLSEQPEKESIIAEARQLVLAIRVEEKLTSPQKIDAIWANINTATSIAEKATVGRRVWLRRMAYVAAAASVALLLFFYFFNPTTTERVYAGRGELIQHTLPDGSVVSLSAASEITYVPENWEDERRLNLDGEAFFDVTKGSSFVVQTDIGTVRVLGTSFNVNARADAFVVDCFTGRVEVKAGANQTTILTPTAGASWDVQANNWQTYTFDTTRTASWRTGVFYYENQPLEVVYEEVERQFDVTIQTTDSILQMPYTGFFERTNLDSALYRINWPMGLESEQAGNAIKIKSLE